MCVMHVGMHSPVVSVRRQFFHFMWVPEVEFGLGQQVLFLQNHLLLHFGVGHLTPLGLKVTTCDINTIMLTSPACLEKHIQSQGLLSSSSFMQCLLILVLEESSVTLVDLYPMANVPVSGRISAQVMKAIQTLNGKLPLYVQWR